MIQDWQTPLSDRPEWYKTEEGHWRHISYGKNIKQKQVFKTMLMGRNDLCFCGSNKKYKKCCMK
jgi:uncharacterized protein YecA (UPF0149 family)